MLILKDVNKNTPGTVFKYKVMGTEIGLKIKPLTSDISETLRKENPKEDDHTDALIDHVLEGFSGIGDENGPFGMTLENKKRVMNIPGVDGVPGVSAFVFNEAKKLALGIREMELKN